MAYNLPNAWDPGFVLPSNVEDEGLERRGFVTKWAPRGTYDNPSVGYGGFAVPQYIRDEGYGQGTFTTKWQPSGAYNGPKVPHWLNQRPQVTRVRKLPGGGQAVTIQPLGDDEPMPAPFETYGQRAAQVLLGSVANLPAGKREPALRAIMDKVDKSLWTRTQDILKRYRAQGVPIAQALPQAISRAMSTGIAAEIIDAGLRRAAPQAKSLLGLGCYGCMAALGAAKERGGDPSDMPDRTPPPAPVLTAAQEAAQQAQLMAVAQQIQDALASGAGYLDANGVFHYKTDKGILDSVIDTVAGGIATAVNTVAGGVAATASGVGAAVSGAAAGISAVASAVASGSKIIYDVAGLPVRWAIDPIGVVRDITGAVVGFIKDASGAIYDAAGKVIGWVKDAAIAVGNAVKDGLEKLGDLACDLLTTPGVGAAAGAAGGAIAGVPPQAGAQAGQVGAQIAQGACGKAPPAPVPVVAPASSILPIVLLAGAGVLAIALLSGGKKST